MKIKGWIFFNKDRNRYTFLPDDGFDLPDSRSLPWEVLFDQSSLEQFVEQFRCQRNLPDMRLEGYFVDAEIDAVKGWLEKQFFRSYEND